MAIANIKSRWRYGRLEFYDSVSGEVVDILAQNRLMDDFNGPAIDNTNDWNVTAVNAGTATADGGFMILTTGIADDDNVEVASELVFSGTGHAIAECKLRNDDVLKQSFFFGFTDAITEGADLIPLDFSNAGAYLSTASNAAGFVLDTDKTANGDTLFCCSVMANTDTTPVTTGYVPLISTLMRLRVEVIDTTAYYWVNNVFITSIASSVTAATPLCVYLGTINREGAANTLDVDYIRAWCNRTA
jgi:hypothetical protein